MNPKKQLCTLDLVSEEKFAGHAPDSPAHRRLARGFARLQNFEMVRAHRQDPHFGKLMEHRIIWRELLDLELYEIDEQLEKVLAATGAE